MTFEAWLIFFIASLILTMTPGPSVFLAMVHSLKYGVNKTIFTALGDITANAFQMIFVAFGLGVISTNDKHALLFIQWSGIFLLLVMGIKMLLSSAVPVVEKPSFRTNDVSFFKLYWQGFWVAGTNPKAIIFFSAFFPQFISGNDNVLLQMLIMCPTMVILDFCWVMTYAFSAKQFLGWLINYPNYLNRFGGCVLLAAVMALILNNQVI